MNYLLLSFLILNMYSRPRNPPVSNSPLNASFLRRSFAPAPASVPSVRHAGGQQPSPAASNSALDTSSRLAALQSWSKGVKEPGARTNASTILAESKYRPKVKAAKRVSTWTSEFYEKTLADPSYTVLSMKTRQAIDRAALGGLEQSTLQGYGAGLLRFHQFCDDESIPESSRVPASELLICGFAATAAFETRSLSALNTYLAGLRAWHLAQSAPWLGTGSEMLSMAKKGVAKSAPPSSKRAPRQPVTVAHMAALVKGLSIRDSFDIAVKAGACVAFWGIMRLGEVVVATPPSFSREHHASKAARITSDSTRGGVPFLKVTIPWTKTTKNDGADIILNPRPNDPTCPVVALQRHLDVNGRGRGDLSLLAYKSTSESGFTTLRRDPFLARCNEIWKEAGLESLTGHSFRIGGATEMLLQGQAPSVVQKMGRWKSDAFMAYWRSLDEIIPTFVSAGIPREQLKELSEKMERWFRVTELAA